MKLIKKHNHKKYKSKIILSNILYDYSLNLLETLYKNKLSSSVTIDFEKQIEEIFADDYYNYKNLN